MTSSRGQTGVLLGGDVWFPTCQPHTLVKTSISANMKLPKCTFPSEPSVVGLELNDTLWTVTAAAGRWASVVPALAHHVRGECVYHCEPLCEGFELALPGHGEPLTPTALDTGGTLTVETKRCVSLFSEAGVRQSSLPVPMNMQAPWRTCGAN